MLGLETKPINSTRRRALGTLLRRARSSNSIPLSPEEVAATSGVGLDWYRSLEAGHSVGISATALTWVADALELDSAARERMFDLARLRQTGAVHTPRVETVPETLRNLLGALDDLPALAYGRSGDLLAWNDAAAAVYRCDSMPTARRNILLCLFAQPEARTFVLNWEEQALAAAEMVHATADPQDGRLADLLEYLSRTSADFPRLWAQAAGRRVLGSTQKVFTRPPVGRLTFACSHLQPAGEDRLRVDVYQADDAATVTRLASLISTHRRRNTAQQQRARAIQQVRAYLDEHYQQEVQLDDLVGFSGIEKFSLLRWFVNEVGVPPRAYQLLVRIGRARQLLAQGVPAAEAAIQVGFNDQSHLIRRFRQVEGIIPGQFMRQLAPIGGNR